MADSEKGGGMIDWTKQHCGVHRADALALISAMPDIIPLLKTFPDDIEQFSWDVKVHMLMPGQYPCIPNWHFDHVPRIDNQQDFSLVKLHRPMWLWVSGEPLTEFRFTDGTTKKIEPATWVKFFQNSEHRGTISNDFQWRAFVRATHIDIQQPLTGDRTRRHSQVYLDANNFKW